MYRETVERHNTMIPEVSVQTVEAEKNNDGVFLLDVRQPDEYEAQRIDEATLIPLGLLPARVQELEQHKDKKIYVICRSGGRSAQATGFLQQHGYNAYNMVGGMIAYSEL